MSLSGYFSELTISVAFGLIIQKLHPFNKIPQEVGKQSGKLDRNNEQKRKDTQRKGANP